MRVYIFQIYGCVCSESFGVCFVLKTDVFMRKFRNTTSRIVPNLNLFNTANSNKNEEPIDERLRAEQFSLMKVFTNKMITLGRVEYVLL